LTRRILQVSYRVNYLQRTEDEIALLEDAASEEDEKQENAYRGPSKKKSKTPPKPIVDGVLTRTARRQLQVEEEKAKDEKYPFNLSWKEIPNKNVHYLNSPDIKPSRTIFAFDLVIFLYAFLILVGWYANRTQEGKFFYKQNGMHLKVTLLIIELELEVS
jgi:hypothetical protein